MCCRAFSTRSYPVRRGLKPRATPESRLARDGLPQARIHSQRAGGRVDTDGPAADKGLRPRCSHPDRVPTSRALPCRQPAFPTVEPHLAGAAHRRHDRRRRGNRDRGGRNGCNAEQQLAALRAEVARHDQLYHRQAAPEISDYDYDQLKRRLRELEAAFPEIAREAPTVAEIGDDRSGLFQTRRHRERMLSLEKSYAEADLRAFHARLAKLLGRDALAYVVEPKFDGFAVSATYEKGKLARVVTRGNGLEGDDITANAIMIRGSPAAANAARSGRGRRRRCGGRRGEPGAERGSEFHPGCDRAARRNLRLVRGVRAHQRRARGGGRGAVRQSAQPRHRHDPPARRGRRREPRARGCLLRRRRLHAGCRAAPDAARAARDAAPLGRARTGANVDGSRRRRTLGRGAGTGSRAGGIRVSDRWRGREARRCRAPARGRRDRARAALGDGAQVCAGPRGDAGARHRRASRPHRRAHARRGVRAGRAGRIDGRARLAAQPRRGRAARHSCGRFCLRREGRRDHPGDRRREPRAAAGGGAGVCVSLGVPGLRHDGDAAGGRGRGALPERGVPRATAAAVGAFRLARVRRDRRPRPRDDRRAGRTRCGERCRRSLRFAA